MTANTPTSPSGAPAGWRMVPVKPTDHMLSRMDGMTDLIGPTGMNEKADRLKEFAVAWAEALAAAPAPAPEPAEVAVKPLEWAWEPPYSIARVFGGHYAYEVHETGCTLLGSFIGAKEVGTKEAAKAAAQADYEQRIRSALVAPAPAQGPLGEPEVVAWAVLDYTGGIVDTFSSEEDAAFYADQRDDRTVAPVITLASHHAAVEAATSAMRAERDAARQDASDWQIGHECVSSALATERARAETPEKAMSEALTDTGSKSTDDLCDMARVGRSLMDRIGEIVKGGPYKDWMPADDPAEIVTDLINDLEEAIARAETDERLLAEAREDEREAFRAGWKVNAVGTDVHRQEYLDECEEVDWQGYQRQRTALAKQGDAEREAGR